MASKNYRKFIVELQAWHKQGHPTKHGTIFSTRYGICGNYIQWLIKNGVKEISRQDWHLQELKNHLPKHNGEFPFNRSEESFYEEINRGMNWKNIARRYWLNTQKFKSDTIVQFFRDLNSWIDRGCPRRSWHNFAPNLGLCINLTRWCDAKKIDHSQWGALRSELNNLFLSDGYPSTTYPFAKWASLASTYENPERLKFIQKHTKHDLIVQL